MTPKERIYAIRLIEKMSDGSEYFSAIGVDIEFRPIAVEQSNCSTDDF